MLTLALIPFLAAAGCARGYLSTSAATSDAPIASQTTVRPSLDLGSDGVDSIGAQAADGGGSPARGADGGAVAEEELVLMASLATCAGVGVSPATCTQVHGAGNLRVDSYDATTKVSLSAYLAFDLDGQLTGARVSSVALVLRSTDGSYAEAPHSGEIYQAAPFSEASLASDLPALGDRLADGTTNVVPDQEVSFALASSAAAERTLHLAVVPVSDDGVDYWDNTGAQPPRLVIRYRPAEAR